MSKRSSWDYLRWRYLWLSESNPVLEAQFVVGCAWLWIAGASRDGHGPREGYEGLEGSDISPVPDLLVFVCIATF